jgi:hypothetical protein
LPRCEATDAALDAVLEVADGHIDPGTTADDVSRMMDAIQQRLGTVHGAVVDTWFLPDGA